MGNNRITRLPSGVNNVTQDSLFGDYRQMVPQIYHQYFNDFDAYVAADWTITATGSTTTALTAGDNGLLLMTNSGANNDLLALQKNPAAFVLDATRPSWFSSKFMVDNATNAALVMGLQVVDTTPLDVTDGIYFLKSAASTQVAIICRKDATTGSTTATHITDMADATLITLGWYYDGAGKLYYEVNGAVVGSLAVTNFFPDTGVTVSFAVQNGTVAARTMTVDYIMASQARVQDKT